MNVLMSLQESFLNDSSFHLVECMTEFLRELLLKHKKEKKKCVRLQRLTYYYLI